MVEYKIPSLQLPSSEALLGAGRSSDGLHATLPGHYGPSSVSLVSETCGIANVSHPCEDIRACSRLFVIRFEGSSHHLIRPRLIVSGYTSNFFLNGNCRNIPIFVLIYNVEMHLSFARTDKMGKNLTPQKLISQLETPPVLCSHTGKQI